MRGVAHRLLSQKKCVSNAGEDCLLEIEVSSPKDPTQGRGDGANNFASPIDREIVVEDGAARRLTVGLGHVFEELVDFYLHPEPAGRRWIDVDYRQAANRLKTCLESILERRRVERQGSSIVAPICGCVRIVRNKRFSDSMSKYLSTTATVLFQTFSKSVTGTTSGLAMTGRRRKDLGHAGHAPVRRARATARRASDHTREQGPNRSNNPSPSFPHR